MGGLIPIAPPVKVTDRVEISQKKADGTWRVIAVVEASEVTRVESFDASIQFGMIAIKGGGQ